MGVFDQVAKNLVTKQVKGVTPSNVKDIITDLENAGFSRMELLQEYRNLLDRTEEDSVKRQILDSISKMHGLHAPEDNKVAPTIILNVQGDNSKVAIMLNPSLAEGPSSEAAATSDAFSASRDTRVARI